MGSDTAQVGVVAADWTKLLERRAQNASPSPYFVKVAAPKARTETLARGAEASRRTPRHTRGSRAGSTPRSGA